MRTKEFIPDGFQTTENEVVTVPQAEPELTEAESALLTRFRQSYYTANNFAEADHFFSTDMIMEQLSEDIGQLSFTPIWLHNWLQQNGYKQDHIGAMQMVWLLKEM